MGDIKTSERLAQALEEVAPKCSETYNSAHYLALAARARTGEFDDYGTAHVCGPTQIHKELIDLGFWKFAKRIAAGEFDATLEESSEWAQSPEGQEAAKQLTPEMRKTLGMDFASK